MVRLLSWGDKKRNPHHPHPHNTTNNGCTSNQAPPRLTLDLLPSTTSLHTNFCQRSVLMQQCPACTHLHVSARSTPSVSMPASAVTCSRVAMTLSMPAPVARTSCRRRRCSTCRRRCCPTVRCCCCCPTFQNPSHQYENGTRHPPSLSFQSWCVVAAVEPGHPERSCSRC